ncbi:MAG: hypothetical protein RBT63_09590 [Bdellovibrionales bacterium]|jgi:hypothetical protein|nr:hypothetical protein [Bdellovibrionales bacterium]
MINKRLVTLLLPSLFLMAGEFGYTQVYVVPPQTAQLRLDRIDYVSKSDGVPVLIRSFHRTEPERGIFGTGWCSNLDVRLLGVGERQPSTLEIKTCGIQKKRTFRKILEAWVEDSSPSRILRAQDGRWEMTEAPYMIFRQDGMLDSFVTDDDVRWYVRRDAKGRPEALDNLKQRPAKFRRNYAGDLEAILDANGKPFVKYGLGAVLTSVEIAGVLETYEYDANGSVSKLTRKPKGGKPSVWNFSYKSDGQLSLARDPDGCTTRWTFEQTQDEWSVLEKKDCQQFEDKPSGERSPKRRSPSMLKRQW